MTNKELEEARKRLTRTSLRVSSNRRNDLKTSDDLYQLATERGLEANADRVLEPFKGEETSKIYSGGFISDIFDTLNALQYGVTGVVKGKGFIEGVKTRQSFADKDFLGDKGMPGIIGGIALDIFFDPLTYIAPWTIARKIPGVVKATKATEKAVFGKKVIKTIEEAEDVGKNMSRLYQERVGGTKAGKYFADKFSYMFGQDPIYRRTWEKSVNSLGVATSEMSKDVSKMLKFTPETAAKLLTRDATGRIKRVKGEDLKKILSPEEFATVQKAWMNIDDLGKEAVDLGILSKEKFEENVGEYLTNAYKEFELDKTKGLFSAKKVGVKGTKKRVEGLTPEKMEELGQIDNPAYLMFKTSFNLIRDVENAKFMKKVNSFFATNVPQEGFMQLPKSNRLMRTQGLQSAIAKDIGDINTQMKPLFRELRHTFKADKKALGEISDIRREVDRLSGLSGEELAKFFTERGGFVTTPTKMVKQGVEMLPENLQKLGGEVGKFDNIEDLMKSPTGLKLEKTFEEGTLETANFDSIEKFFDFVKKPSKEIGGKEREIASIETKVANLETKLQKQLGRTLTTAKKVEQKKLKDQLKKSQNKLSKLKKEADAKVSKSTALATTNKIARIDELMKAPKLGKEMFKELERFKKSLLSASKRVTKLEESELLKIESKLVKYEEELLDVGVKKLVSMQKQMQKLTNKSKKLTEIDKTSIDNSFIHIEKQLSDLKFAKDEMVDEIKEVKLLDLAGKWVPESVFNHIQLMNEPFTETLGTKLVGIFKYNKVILNPATHARNIMSNMVLNWWKLGIGPWRLDLYTEAMGEITKKGGGKWIKEMTDAKVGYNIGTFRNAELQSILGSSEVNKFSKGLGSKGARIKEAIGKMYEGEENLAKVSAYIFHRKKGISIEESWKAAESATFNYAQVTPFIQKMRQSLWGMPFITFTLKSTPVAIETALKHPTRISVFGKIKNGIEKASDVKETDREKASAPQWIRDGLFVKLPFKDSEDRSAYLDLTYIIPFGDITSGQFLERPTVRETGTKEAAALSLASKAPAFNLIKELSRNQNFYGRKIWLDSDSTDKQQKDILKHISKTFLPPIAADLIPSGYNTQGEEISTGLRKVLTPEEKTTQQRTIGQEIAKQFGMKIQPVDVDLQETMQEWNKKKAMSTMLREQGVLKEFSTNYIPKEE